MAEIKRKLDTSDIIKANNLIQQTLNNLKPAPEDIAHANEWAQNINYSLIKILEAMKIINNK